MRTHNNNATYKTFASSVVVILMVCLTQGVFAQADGTNFDFNYGPVGNYTYWKGYQGTNESDETSSTYVFSAWTPFNDPATCYLNGTTHCFVINSDTNATDPIVGSGLKKIPSGYKRSTQINCDPTMGSPNANANKLSYDLAVTSQNCLLTFNYAMVLESPGHANFANPFFLINVFAIHMDGSGNYVTDSLVNACATFYVQGKTPAPAGWNNYGSGYITGIWHDWQQVSMNLTNFIGDNVRIEISLASCCYTAHYAYGYFVGKVGPSQLSVNACGDGDIVAEIVAPPGFQKYEWFANPNDLPESELSSLTNGTPLYQSEATATAAANNKFTITNGVYSQYGQKFFVKVTSPSSSPSIPGCVAYMKATAQSIKPIAGYTATANCNLQGIFNNTTTFPVEGDEDEEGNPIAKEYTWNFGDGDTLYYSSLDTTTNANISPTHTYATPGTYTVTLKASYDGCAHQYTNTIDIPATPSFSLKDTIICIGDNLTLSVLDTVISNATYVWKNLADASIHEGVTLSNIFNEKTVYEVTSSSATSSCTFKDTVTVEVQQFPAITLQGDTMLCLGEIANITATDATGNTQLMQWTFTDPGVPPAFVPGQPTTNSPVLTFTPTTDTTVYLIAQTNRGCFSSKSLHIYITDPKVWANKYKVCPEQEVVLHGTKAVKYSWSSLPVDSSLVADVVSDADTIVVKPKQTTVYTMKGYGASGCYAERTVQVTVIPVPTPIITYSPDYVDVDNPILTLKDDSPYGYSTHWQISDGSESDLRSFTHYFTNVSEDSVQIFMTSTNEVNCSADTSVALPIELFSVWVPNAFSPNGDGTNDYFFPSSRNKLVDVTFEVYNRWGKKVYSYQASKLDCSSYDNVAKSKGWNGQFNSKDVPKGAYAWRLTFKREGNERVYDKKGMINVIR